MNSLFKTGLVLGAVAASLMLLPLLFKGVVITAATLLMALVIAAVFILGILVAVVLLSPLWIPFLAGWAAVRFCKKYYKSEAPPKT